MDGEPRSSSRISENREEALSYLQNSSRNCDAMMEQMKGSINKSAAVRTLYDQIWSLKQRLESETRTLSARTKDTVHEVDRKRLDICLEDIKELYKFQGRTANFTPELVEGQVAQLREDEGEKYKTFSDRLHNVREACNNYKSLVSYRINEGTEEEKKEALWVPIDPMSEEQSIAIKPIDYIIHVEESLRAHVSHRIGIAFPDHELRKLNRIVENGLTELEQLPFMPQKVSTEAQK